MVIQCRILRKYQHWMFLKNNDKIFDSLNALIFESPGGKWFLKICHKIGAGHQQPPCWFDHNSITWQRYYVAASNIQCWKRLGGRQPGGFFVIYDDVIKWKHFLRYWPFVRGIHRSPVNSPHKGQWRGALMFSSICVWITDLVNNGDSGDLRRYRAHYDVTVMSGFSFWRW